MTAPAERAAGIVARGLTRRYGSILAVDHLDLTVAPGEVGVLIHYDAVNTGSVLAVQTSDAGVWRDDGFEVLGREAGAEERGCSIAADELLSGARA